MSLASGQLAEVFFGLNAQRLTADQLSTLSHSLGRVDTQVGNGQHRDCSQSQQQYQQSRPDTSSNRQTRGWLGRGDGRRRGFSLFSSAQRHPFSDLFRLRSGYRRGFRHDQLSFGWLGFEGANDCFLLCLWLGNDVGKQPFELASKVFVAHDSSTPQRGHGTVGHLGC